MLADSLHPPLPLRLSAVHEFTDPLMRDGFVRSEALKRLPRRSCYDSPSSPCWAHGPVQRRPRDTQIVPLMPPLRELDSPGDRKSTRLNSSHANISYAVFCLKK